ncbi:MAG: septum formation initiator family protein [Butyrivibrio sp.]|nr:septum formation initiator family protein [Butyrivibrio sp.]
MKKREKLRGQKPSNKLVGFAVVIIVAALVFAVSSMSRSLEGRNNRDSAKIEQLRNEIEQEKERAEQLEAYEKYVNTKQFVEEIARDKMGLIYPDEKIFKEE